MSQEKRDINNTAELESNSFPWNIFVSTQNHPKVCVSHSSVLLHDPVGAHNHTHILGTIIHAYHFQRTCRSKDQLTWTVCGPHIL